MKDVHDAWSMNMNYKKQTEHCYGREHKSIIPFNDLDKETQNKDIRFLGGLHRVVDRLKQTGGLEN